MINEREVNAEVSRLSTLVASYVIELLDAKGMTRADLARKLGTSRAHVTQLLDGERNMSLETIAKLSLALDTNWSINTYENMNSANQVLPAGWIGWEAIDASHGTGPWVVSANRRIVINSGAPIAVTRAVSVLSGAEELHSRLSPSNLAVAG